MSTCFAKFHPNLVIGGTYCGQIVLWDNRSNKRTPIQRTPLSAAAHTVSINTGGHHRSHGQYQHRGAPPHTRSVSTQGGTTAHTVSIEKLLKARSHQIKIAADWSQTSDSKMGVNGTMPYPTAFYQSEASRLQI